MLSVGHTKSTVCEEDTMIEEHRPQHSERAVTPYITTDTSVQVSSDMQDPTDLSTIGPVITQDIARKWRNKTSHGEGHV